MSDLPPPAVLHYPFLQIVHYSLPTCEQRKQARHANSTYVCTIYIIVHMYYVNGTIVIEARFWMAMRYFIP